MTWHRDHSSGAASAILLLAVVSMLISEVAFAQSNEDPVSRFEGRYTGIMHRGPAGFLGGWPPPGTNESATRKDKRDPAKSAGDNRRKSLEFSGDVGSPEAPIAIRFSLLSEGDHWKIEFRYADDRGELPIPLPKAVALTMAKSPTQGSPVKLDDLPPQSWMAWAFRGDLSLTIYLVDLGSTSEPIAFQVFLHYMHENLVLILWRLDWGGHRSTSWSSILKRE